MSTITKERLQRLIRAIDSGNYDEEEIVGWVNSDEILELARIALASLEAEESGRNPVLAYADSYRDMAKQGVESIPVWSVITDLERNIAPLYSATPAPVVPAELHPDTLKLVTDFSSALAEKLYKAQLKYGYDADWKQDGWPSQCQADFQQHIAKGDPRDVAAYCAFMWYHGWKTEPAPVSVPDEALKRLLPDAEKAEFWFEHDGKILFEGVKFNNAVLKACRAAMLQSFGNSEQLNSPVIPDGWISCSERMPDDGQHVIIICDGAFVLYAQYRDGEFFDVVRDGDEFFETQSRNVTHWMPLPEPPQGVNRG